MEGGTYMTLNSSSEPPSTEEVEAHDINDDEISSKVNNEYNEEESLPVGNPCDIDSIHSRMCQEWIPVVGMEFETEKDAHDFYNRYAYKFGFGTRLSKAHTSSTGFVRDRIFVCSAEGKREKNKRSIYVKVHRAKTRFGCQARMKIRYDSSVEKYIVSKFIANHTHLTSTPRKTHRFRSHRKISLAQNVMADMAEDSGLNPKETLELLSRQAGGREHLGFIAEDYRNYLRSKRTREMKSGDTGGVLEYQQKMQSNDPSFTYAIQVDADDLITNIFWADAKMKVDYDYFGDVVCFDTTYRKNKEGRSFAMFIGVNNHKQTLIFGAALLYDETAETFIWLFDTFVNTMSGKKPKSILTDQDPAMAKALATQWPESHHRLCIWHIYQNAAKHLKCVFEEFKDFAKEFSSIIYDYEDVEDFLIAWQKMLEKYKLEDNTWLSRLFDVKEKWALVYGRGTFSADITTTQRSESMNNSIKRYVTYKYDLLRFFRHFQRLVDDRRYKELIADFRASHTIPTLSFPVKILKDAAKVYTPALFKWFEVELCKAHDCTFKLFNDIGTMRIYEVTAHGKCFHHIVTFDLADNTISCSCKKFEFAGILCSHALKVLSTNDVKTIPSQYISKRWRKDIKDQVPKESYPNINDDDDDDRKGKIARRYRDFARLHTELTTIAAESDEAYEIASNALHMTLADVKTHLRTCQKPPEDITVINNTTHEVVNDEFGEHIVKGIKALQGLC
ncbi:protein FAR1-RELATED SEQUENCE 5-like [Euphorbia lathyris]|uniref:protein FAR1-RELATED SEQUENCE 5-like n=1 Tax=Euphorbia lathyris TaxID=212925 RepID=UPI0033131F7E